MHTIWVRLNAVIFFGLTVLLSLSILAAVSKYGHEKRYQPVLNKLQINKLRSLKSHGGVDRALLTFDLNVDLRPAFHWNIKQLFVFVVATYATDTNPKNEVVLWDKIVEAIHPNDMIIQEDNIIVKYALVDQGAELRGKEVQLRLMWDHMPLTGGLFMAESTNSSTFVLPTEYK
mmetsp:Transcript_20796/g.29654  ORF Transcript_20796/g.29654 Transcript_20796/m.29654 type:complete len:174 (+) Transcript_20796:244-765(+)|eukprot:CAMPEP_0172424686 /NCGR_PEP_ID=MMETSP1064-20121228/27297_1 /TAXON_ID=202472 /ORGANISM="Aulacoseira subarctica , Strain CCAP 1002/5" /LENGTH=173 /DNA_ID=CAMNT_0013166991 /DNA_START=179 /DNA_END=700 /DNA_ORIENTATION=-